MKTNKVLYAEDGPHRAARDTQAMDTFDALTQGQILDPPYQSADPDWPHTVSRRILQVTDEDETLVPEFIPLDKIPFFKR